MEKTTNKTKAPVKVPPITPLGDRVLVRALTEEEMGTKSPSGIIIPETAKSEKSDRGVVLAVGTGKRDEKGARIELEVSVGDKVLFQWGEKIEYGKEEYFIVREDNLLAIIN